MTDLQTTAPRLLGLLFGLTALASSATSVVVPDIAAELDLETSGIAAVFVAFSVAFAATTAVYGRLGDLHGQRRPLIAGITLLAIGSIGSALAPNLTLLLLGRVIQGAGAGAVPALVPGIINTRIDEDQQPAALTVVAAIAGVFAAVGPFLGGASAAIVNWRLAVAIPAVGLLLIPAIGSIAPNTGDSSSRLDQRGAFLTAVTATGLVLLLQAPGLGLEVGAVGAAMLAPAGTLLAKHFSANPKGFVPRTIAAHPSFWMNALVGAGLAGVYLSILLSVPVRLATNEAWSALQIGAALAPAAAAGPLASIVSKKLNGRVSSAALAGTGVAAAGFGAIGSAAIGSLGIQNGSLTIAAFAIAAGLFLARPHDTTYEACVRSTGTIAGALHCLATSPPTPAPEASIPIERR